MSSSDDGTAGRSRREFLAHAAVLTTAAATLGCTDGGRLLAPAGVPRGARATLDPFPDPKTSGIEHVVVLMMENRSFDHLLGWTPGANGRQAGLAYRDRAGVAHATYPLAPDFQGCRYADPDHSYAGARAEYNGGACDGWLRAGTNDIFSIGYYRQQDLGFFGRAVPDWTTSDRYFAAILGPTFPNRIYQHAAQTDRTSNTLTIATLPTIWDRLAAAHVSGRYYYADLPFVALWGTRYLSIARPADEFFAACAAGTLPAVSFLDGSFLGEFTGTGSDDHPHSDVRSGEHYLNQVYQAVTQGKAWDRTLLVINFDEWGGFFDHVPPPVAPIPAADAKAGFTDGLRGFRVPLLVVSPYARRGYVGHDVMDHTSVLRFIEWRWNLDPLTVRDAGAANLARLLDFTNPTRNAPQYTVPAVRGKVCLADLPFFERRAAESAAFRASGVPASASGADTAGAPRSAAWAGLRGLATASGFAVGG